MQIYKKSHFKFIFNAQNWNAIMHAIHSLSDQENRIIKIKKENEVSLQNLQTY